MPSDDHLDGRDVDAEFAAIIAGWDTVPDLPPSLTDEPTGEPTDEHTDEPRPDPTAAGDADLQGREAPTAGPTRGPEGDVPPEPGSAAAPEAVVAGAPLPVRPASPAGRETPPPGIVEAGLEEGHFEPRPVQLPPHEDLHFWGIVVGLTLGPLLLLWMAFFGEGHSRWWTYAAFALVIGGFALLVLRQPRSRDEDDRDDGARV